MSENCVCVEGDFDGDMPEFYSTRRVKARKAHECYECLELIPAGATCVVVAGRWDGEFSTYRFCVLCDEIGSSGIFCHGRTFGTMWDELEDQLFPGFHSTCLERLSTVDAKQFLAQRWMRWVNKQAERQSRRQSAETETP